MIQSGDTLKHGGSSLEVWFNGVTPPTPPKTLPFQTQRKRPNINEKWMREGGREGGCREGSIYRQQGEGVGRCSAENKSYLRWCVGGWWGGGGSRRGRGRKDRHSSFTDTMADTFSNNCWPLLRHFFFLLPGWGSEGAGRGRGQPLPDVDSVVTRTAEASLRASATRTPHTLENCSCVFSRHNDQDSPPPFHLPVTHWFIQGRCDLLVCVLACCCITAALKRLLNSTQR